MHKWSHDWLTLLLLSLVTCYNEILVIDADNQMLVGITWAVNNYWIWSKMKLFYSQERESEGEIDS